MVYNNNGTRWVYAGTGNGGFQTGNTNWGSSVLGFSEALTGGPPSTSFTPETYGRLNYHDQDMGTSGPLLTSANDLVIFDKTGKGYVLNPLNLGGIRSGDTGALGEFTSASLTAGGTCDGGANGGSTACDEITSQVFWTDSAGNSYLFVWPWNENVDWCLWNSSNNTFQCYASNQNPVGFPGGTLVLSSNGNDISTAVLWAITLPSTAQAFVNPDTQQLASYDGILHAYKLVTPPTMSQAGTLTELWNSSADTWVASKFAMPAVVNGRIYVPTYSQGVIVYANY